MLHVVTVRRRGALVLCEFVLDRIEVTMFADEARQIGDALMRASFAPGGEVHEVWAVESELLEVDDDRNTHGG